MADGRSASRESAGPRGKSGHHKAACRVERTGGAGESPPRRKVSQKTNRPRFGSLLGGFPVMRARVKRRGKSPPPRAQVRGHEKPHAVQDRTGGIGLPARSPARKRRGILRVIVAARKSRTGRKTGTRQMTVQVRGENAGPDRIRLTAIRKAGALPKGGAPVHLILKTVF